MNMTVSRDSNLVDSSMAAYLASYYNIDVFLKKNKSTTQRSFSSAFSIPDKNGNPALYVFNYVNNEGYVVISADFRYQPILSLCENGSINPKDDIPSMLGSWFGRMEENVELLRDGKYDNAAIGYHEWNDLMGGGYVPPNNMYLTPDDPGSGPYSGGDCTPIDYSVGPLLHTTWSQGCYFNVYTPGCAVGSGECGHTPTGCVATAMAQIIKYWAPANGYNYNYAAMDDIYNSTEAARLMHDAGLSVNTDYHCANSGAGTGGVAHALTSNFGFASATHSSTYNAGSDFYQTIVGDLNNNKPVLFGGCPSQISFWQWHWGIGKCHAWVCDGYHNQGTTCALQTWAYINWGQEYGTSNGAYYIDDWHPIGYSYQYNSADDFTYNIHP